ncbi:putative MFS family arabinose efflux permease [Diaminobutyricimonas aerilata]|uniref:Putative MFS family arabinose efflux permease n=1 Tax=Diaminobutyricimonas aerilata TaxID=1162967 RepID=A0A2M9CJD5_9MICO|nr:MFS transporter [Diaminobutyricimonas aerilata]PJJ71958.1 putative MFS family arabinose efflux permease [Diaminobutyricimonas aerilata]
MTATATPASAPAVDPERLRTARRVTWASLVGTALESYDFYVYAYFAAFFVGPLFFESLGAFAATLSAFITIGVGFIVRPLGAIVFGHLGDRIGRRRTLLVTIAIMGVATGLIGLLPPYAVAGWVGAILLVLLRLVQGFSLGGEWGGAILLASEHAPLKRRAFAAAMPQLGSPIGSILAAAVFLVMTASLSPEAMTEWGWRIPFLTAIPLLLVSLYLRWSIDETPVFRDIVQEGRRDRVPLAKVFAQQPTALVIAVGAALLGIGSYSLMNTYTVNYGVTSLGFDYTQLLIATTIGGLLQLVTIPLFGAWANRIGSARVVAIGAAGTLIVTFPMYYLLQFSTFEILVATMLIGGILPTLSWAALGGLMADLFADHYRYSALSIAYSVAAVLSGFVPALTAVVARETDNAWWHPGIVLAIMSAVTLVAAIAAARKRSVDA